MKTPKKVTMVKINETNLKGYRICKFEKTIGQLIPEGSIFMRLILIKKEYGENIHQEISSVWAVPLIAFTIKKVSHQGENTKQNEFKYQFELKPVLESQFEK